jgi:hypothetical protein
LFRDSSNSFLAYRLHGESIHQPVSDQSKYFGRQLIGLSDLISSILTAQEEVIRAGEVIDGCIRIAPPLGMQRRECPTGLA